MNSGRQSIERLKRVVVIGTSCSGKTTFARSLAKATGVEHIELDAIYWLPDWTPRQPSEFRAMVADTVAKDRWILDGNYSKTRDIVWPRATAIIWLDYSFPIIIYRALSRTMRRILYRQTLYSGNRESLQTTLLSRDSILLWVLKTYSRHRSEYPRLLQEAEKANAQVLVLRSSKEAREFLSQIERGLAQA